jgi:hypothetical protein
MVFLILDQYRTEFSLRLKAVAEREGLDPLLLTSAEVSRDLALVFCLSGQDASLRLTYRENVFGSEDLSGVYCGINAFEPSLWPQFTEQDAEYAAREIQALWLAILTSLPCRVVNPPALDTLAGTLLSTPEVFYLARQLGFRIPMVVTLESGKAAAELLATGSLAWYADLGETWVQETGFMQVDLSSLAQREHHHRVREIVPGRPVWISLVGDQALVCTQDTAGTAKPFAADEIPQPVMTRLRALHRRLNLNVAEYHLTVTDGAWVFSGYGRPPTLAAAAFGDTLFERILDFATSKAH